MATYQHRRSRKFSQEYLPLRPLQSIHSNVRALHKHPATPSHVGCPGAWKRAPYQEHGSQRKHFKLSGACHDRALIHPPAGFPKTPGSHSPNRWNPSPVFALTRIAVDSPGRTAAATCSRSHLLMTVMCAVFSIRASIFRSDVIHGRGPIHHKEHQIRLIQRFYGSLHADSLHQLVGFAQSCRIEKSQRHTIQTHAFTHDIPRRPGNIRHNCPICAHKPIEQTGFSDIWFADNRQPKAVRQDLAIGIRRPVVPRAPREPGGSAPLAQPIWAEAHHHPQNQSLPPTEQ